MASLGAVQMTMVMLMAHFWQLTFVLLILGHSSMSIKVRLYRFRSIFLHHSRYIFIHIHTNRLFFYLYTMFYNYNSFYVASHIQKYAQPSPYLFFTYSLNILYFILFFSFLVLCNSYTNNVVLSL